MPEPQLAPRLTGALVSFSLRLVLGVLNHLPACLFAATALLGTRLHHGILPVLFAGFSTAGAGLRTGGANQIGEWSPPGNNLRGGSTKVGTVLARPLSFQMLFLPLRYHSGTVSGTGIADPLAGIARFGALLISGVLAVRSRRLRRFRVLLLSGRVGLSGDQADGYEH
jgi:hypothetical protein